MAFSIIQALKIFAFQPLRHDKFTAMTARSESVPFKNSALPNASGDFLPPFQTFRFFCHFGSLLYVKFMADNVDTAVVIVTKVKWLFENLEIFEFV